MKAIPSASAFASGARERLGVANNAPLSPIARTKRPLASGEAISALTASDPADSPAIVTVSGSPPKAAMLRLDPLQRRDQIQHAIVAGCAMFGLAAQLRMGEKAKRVEAVVEVTTTMPRAASRVPS